MAAWRAQRTGHLFIVRFSLYNLTGPVLGCSIGAFTQVNMKLVAEMLEFFLFDNSRLRNLLTNSINSDDNEYIAINSDEFVLCR